MINVSDKEILLRNLNNNLKKFPSLIFSTNALVHLNHVARCRDGDNKDIPAFPEALAYLLAQQNEDGSIKTNTSIFRGMPLLMTVMLINTLLIWDNKHNDLSKNIQVSINYLFKLITNEQVDVIDYPQEKLCSEYGKYYNSAISSPEIFYYEEINLFLSYTNNYLNEEQKLTLQKYCLLFADKSKVMRFALTSSNKLNLQDIIFKKEYARLLFAEFLPNEIFSFPNCTAYFNESFCGYGPFSATLAAKFYQQSRDERAYRWLKNNLTGHPLNIMPQHRLAELVFSFWYLFKAGVDIKHYFADHISVLLSYELSGDGGYGFQLGMHEPDCETSAIVYCIANQLSLPIRMSVNLFERWWDKERQYYHVINQYVRNLSANLNIVNAYLCSPNISFENKQKRWSAILQTFANIPWAESHHLSPFYTWETIVSLVSQYYMVFPDIPTDLHHLALKQILCLRHPSGGFGSAAIGKPNAIETAFALLAIKRAIKNYNLFDNEIELRRIAKTAEIFILNNWIPFNLEMYNKKIWRPYPELWITELATNLINTDDAIIIASLLME